MTEEQQQQARKIVETVANIDVNHLTLHVHDGRLYGCHCTMRNHLTHAEDCPVVQARLFLKEI